MSVKTLVGAFVLLVLAGVGQAQQIKNAIPEAALSATEMLDFASVLKDVLVRFDNLWQMPFPYVMPLHQAPTDGNDYSGFHFHIEFHPPLRKPDLMRFLAGPKSAAATFSATPHGKRKPPNCEHNLTSITKSR